MRVRGGYNLLLEGRPAGRVQILPDPHVLFIPLAGRRFNFSALLVEEGQRVRQGELLARDPANHHVPLLAPRGAVVRLKAEPGHLVLDDVAREEEEPYHPGQDAAHVPQDASSAGIKRRKLLVLGAWQFVQDAHTGRLPNPLGMPQAAIVSTLRLEPYGARGDVQLSHRLSAFTRGLEQIQSLLEYQPIYLVLPDVQSPFATRVRDAIRGYAWANLVAVERKYPFDDFSLLARRLGLKMDADRPVWALRTEGVLAFDRALTLSRPSSVRIISLAGPAVKSPTHLKAMHGYPIKEILAGRLDSNSVRILDGGVLTGRSPRPAPLGVDTECSGLTVLHEHEHREFLAFMRPGWDRKSYGHCFLSALRIGFRQRLSTALGGEKRPCVSCGFCEELCPAGLMPHLIHKIIYHSGVEELEPARPDLCIGCGLCSYVCPSKIDLRCEIQTGWQDLQRELHAGEAPA